MHSFKRFGGAFASLALGLALSAPAYAGYPAKPVQLCIRVPDADAWHEYARARQVAALSELFVSEHLGIRAFVFDDPEGYQIEIQSATRPGA